MGCEASVPKQTKDPKSKVDAQQVAGHSGTLKFEGGVLKKISAPAEAKNYALIYSEPKDDDDAYTIALRKLKDLVPLFYGSEDI